MQASDLRKRVTTVDKPLTCGFLEDVIMADIRVPMVSLSPAPQHLRGVW